MKPQSFESHSRYVPLFHFGLFAVCIACFVMAIINVVNGINLLSVLLLLMSIALCLSFAFIRAFPLAVQDRAIRAEENLRHFALTGKLLDPSLTMSQIIALRFAGDNELVDLASKAAKNSMSNKEIKQSIKNWRADHHRA